MCVCRVCVLAAGDSQGGAMEASGCPGRPMEVEDGLYLPEPDRASLHDSEGLLNVHSTRSEQRCWRLWCQWVTKRMTRLIRDAFVNESGRQQTENYSETKFCLFQAPKRAGFPGFGLFVGQSEIFDEVSLDSWMIFHCFLMFYRPNY